MQSWGNFNPHAPSPARYTQISSPKPLQNTQIRHIIVLAAQEETTQYVGIEG